MLKPASPQGDAHRGGECPCLQVMWTKFKRSGTPRAVKGVENGKSRVVHRSVHRSRFCGKLSATAEVVRAVSHDPLAGLRVRRTEALGPRDGCLTKLSRPRLETLFTRTGTGEGQLSSSPLKSSPADADNRVWGPRKEPSCTERLRLCRTFRWVSASCCSEACFCGEILEHIIHVFLRSPSSESEWLDVRARTFLDAVYKRC